MAGVSRDFLEHKQGTTQRLDGVENRQSVRVALQTPGYLRLSTFEEGYACTVIDVSDGGIQIALPTVSSPFPVTDEPFLLKFRVGSEYTIEAAFVWGGLIDRKYRMGFEWLHLDDPQVDHLRFELMRLAVHRRRSRHTR